MQTVKHHNMDLTLDEEDSMGKTFIEKGEWEPFVDTWINKYTNEGDIAVDIGGKFGIHTLAFADNVGEDGEVYVFEPNPRFRKILRKNIEQNNLSNVYIYPVGISYTHKTADYSVIEGRSSNQSYIGEADETYRVLEVPLSRILHRYDVVKIDVEGAEEHIIPALNFPSMNCAIIEFHEDVLSESKVNELVGILKQYGKAQWEGNTQKMLWRSE